MKCSIDFFYCWWSRKKYLLMSFFLKPLILSLKTRNEKLRQYQLITRKHLVSVSLARCSSQILVSLSDRTLNPWTVNSEPKLQNSLQNYDFHLNTWPCLSMNMNHWTQKRAAINVPNGSKPFKIFLKNPFQAAPVAVKRYEKSYPGAGRQSSRPLMNIQGLRGK